MMTLFNYLNNSFCKKKYLNIEGIVNSEYSKFIFHFLKYNHKTYRIPWFSWKWTKDRHFKLQYNEIAEIYIVLASQEY